MARVWKAVQRAATTMNSTTTKKQEVPCDHQTSAHHNQHDTQAGGEFFIVLGGDSNVSVAYAHAMVVITRDGDDEREDPQD